VFAEGATPDPDRAVDPRRYLPHALLATAAVVVAPALVVVPLAPLEGIADVLLSVLFATALSVAAGSACAALWTRRPDSQELVFGDLMLWRWIRRVRAERRVGEAIQQVEDQVALTAAGDPLLPALTSLSQELDTRDPCMDGHTRRVTRHAERIAKQMGLDPNEVACVKAAASVHDVGRLFTPPSIIAQPGVLTEGEYEVVKRHAVDGAELVAELGDPELTAIVRHHHERVDGAGYPDGLAGAEIPLGARIVAVADTFDALTSPRPHRRAASHANALDELSRLAGSQLDPHVVSAFHDYYSGKRSIAGVALVATGPQRVVSWLAATPASIGASVPPLAQGVCTAGAVAVLGACVASTPALTSSGSGDVEAAGERANGALVAGSATPGAGPLTDDRAGRRDGGNGGDTEDDRSATPGPQDQPRSSPGGDAPAQAPGTQAPASSGPAPSQAGTAPRTPPESPAVPDAPDLDPPPVPVPVDPPDVVSPVVETVEKVLPPPVQDIVVPVLDPVKQLLGPNGLGL
jgi:HD-GYP domain-containing protein (c-di-GMP phosphodiesterase class II)